MKNLLSATLIALSAFGIAATTAIADDDDHWRKSSFFRHSPKCRILTVEVTAESKLIIEGLGLTKRSRIPTVLFGGTEVPVDPATLTAEHIEADLTEIELAETPKDYLLEVERSRWDFNGCPSHMVTVVPAPVEETDKIVFVTSTVMTGAMGGLDGADAECNARAAAAQLPGTFVAYLSVESMRAIDRLPVDGGPWFNRKGELVAADPTALTTESAELNFLENAIRYDEMGDEPTIASVWTGTDEFGFSVSGSHCENWMSESGTSPPGLANQKNFQWVTGESFSCDQEARLYCFQN